MLIGTLVTAALVSSGVVEMYFSYRETEAELLNAQQERATSAAEAIVAFLANLESQMGWAHHAAFLPGAEAIEQRRLDFGRMLRQAPAITEIVHVEASGREQILVSRLAPDRVGRDRQYADDPVFVGARTKGRQAGQVYFRRGSEPYMRLGLADPGRTAGVTIAEVNLRLVWDLVAQARSRRVGHAFLVDSGGLLIAHPDTSLVLKKTDLSDLPQVADALSGRRSAAGTIERNLEGRRVLSSHARVESVGWTVFVETPTSEALAPIYDSIGRTVVLLLAGIALSILAGVYLARRIVEPIRALRLGAAEIGSGHLEHRIRIDTGDELEELAADFNGMTVKLEASYDQVERLSELKRYFSPHLADAIVSSNDDSVTRSHRRDITVLFCDLRSFTRFSSGADPEVVMDVLGQYFDALGRRLLEFEATIDHYAGDGLMAFFNDPIPCADPAARAVRMAVAMRRDVGELIETWRSHCSELGFGVGIASGEATIGHIGAESGFQYTAIGSVANLASRLCDEARDGEILVSEPVLAEVADLVDASPAVDRTFKGFPAPVRTANILGLR